MQEFKERLKDLRQDKHLTQDKMAELTGISQGSISAYELGKAEPTITVIIILCKFFGVSADYLLGLSDDI